MSPIGNGTVDEHRQKMGVRFGRFFERDFLALVNDIHLSSVQMNKKGFGFPNPKFLLAHKLSTKNLPGLPD